MAYDRVDKRLLAALRRDSMKRLLEYSTETRTPKSTVHQRLRKLLREGVRCTPLLDWPKLGCPLTVCFYVPYNEELIAHPCINTAQRVSPHLLYLECIFSSIKDVETFKERLKAARYFTIVEVLKREGFVPKEEEEKR
jgi:DNA-binding Lrp family transcriptional regulator